MPLINRVYLFSSSAAALVKETYGISRGKDMSNILGAIPDEEEEEETTEKEKPKKKKRLMDLDVSEEESAEDSGDDFKLQERYGSIAMPHNALLLLLLPSGKIVPQCG